MTEQPITITPVPPRSAYSPAPGSPLYAEPMPADQIRELNDRRVRQDQEYRDRAAKVDAAFRSKEAERIRNVVLEDGNVDDWREFVSFCGGILEVVAMVDEHGLPDTDRIIPKVDALFDKHVQKELKAGSPFRRGMRNRPYVAGRGTAAGETVAAAKRMAGEDREISLDEAERLLEAERAPKPRTTARR